MSVHQVLFLTDNYDATALWLKGVQQFHGSYSITLVDRKFALPDPAEIAGNYHLIIIEAEARTMVDALEVCVRLRAQKDMIILFMAPLADENSALEAYEMGASEYIVTPISPALFHAKVAAWQRWTVSALAKS